MILLGLDIIDQYTSTISNFGGRVMLRIQSQIDEIDHMKNFTNALYEIYIERNT